MPTMTFSVAVSADDGVVTGNSSTYPPTVGSSSISADTGLTLNRNFSLGFYSVDVVLMRWNTSTLPAGATITGAVLRCFVSAVTNANARSVLAEWYSTANWPIDSVGDYASTAPATPVASRSLSLITVNALNDLPFSDLSGINTAGYTGIRLHISGSTPTGVNSMTISAFDHATSPEPQLIITYTLPLVDLTGASSGTGTTAGTIKHTVKLTGALVDAVNLIANLYIDKHVFGGLTAAATVPASIKIGHLISGGAIGAATTTASIKVIHRLSGALTGAATATASIKVGRHIAGVTMGAAASTGSLQVKRTMSASAIAGGTVSARLSGTFVVTAEWDDGFWASPVSGGFTTTLVMVQRTETSASVGFVRFDTSGLPDNAVIKGAYLRLPVLQVEGGGAGGGVWSLLGEYYPAWGGPSARIPLGEDWTDSAPSVPLFAVDQMTIPNTAAWLDIAIPSFEGFFLNGYTAFRLHISQGQGAYATRGVYFTAFDDPMPARSTAMLVVSYGLYALLTGAGQGAATAAATLTVTHHAAGSAHATAVILGSLDKSAYLLTGSVTAQGVLSASLHVTTHLTGAATGLASLQAAMAITTHLAGTANGEATINAVLNLTIAMVASVDGDATVVAELSVTHHLQAAPIGQGRVDGLLSLPSFVAGAVRGTGFASAVITHIVHVDAVVMASATAAATSRIFKNMVGSPTGQAVVTANLRISHVRMEGVFTGQAALTGSLHIAHRMQGFTIGTATAQATMGPVNHITGIVTGTAVSVVVLRHIVRVRGRVVGQAYTAAVLMWVNIQTIHCEPLTGVHTAPGCTGLSPVATISSENLVTLHTIGK